MRFSFKNKKVKKRMKMLILTCLLIMCVSTAQAQDPEPIVAMDFISAITADYTPPIDPEAQYHVDITFTFNDINGTLTSWLQQEMQKYQIKDETCSYRFSVTRVDEKSVASEELSEASQELQIEQQKLQIERRKLEIEAERVRLTRQREELKKGNIDGIETVSYSDDYQRCLDMTDGDYEYCEDAR